MKKILFTFALILQVAFLISTSSTNAVVIGGASSTSPSLDAFALSQYTSSVRSGNYYCAPRSSYTPPVNSSDSVRNFFHRLTQAIRSKPKF